MSKSETIVPAKSLAHREKRGKDVYRIPLSRLTLEEGFNKRDDDNYGDIEGLAQSIIHRGQLTPIRGFKSGKDAEGKDTWVANVGHRRYMAFQLIAKQTGEEPLVDVVLGSSNIVDRLYEQYTENIKQPNSDFERALIVETLMSEGETKEKIIAHLGISTSTFYMLKELISLPEEAKEEVRKKAVSSIAILGMVRAANGDNAKLNESIAAAKSKAAAEGKTKVTARHIDGDKSRTMATMIKGVVTHLEAKVEAEKELTDTEQFTLALFTKLKNKVSDRTLNDFIRKGQ